MSWSLQSSDDTASYCFTGQDMPTGQSSLAISNWPSLNYAYSGTGGYAYVRMVPTDSDAQTSILTFTHTAGVAYYYDSGNYTMLLRVPASIWQSGNGVFGTVTGTPGGFYISSIFFGS